MEDVKYLHSEDLHNTRDANEIVPCVMKFISPKSVVDVGCGLGTFLKVFKEHGVKEILGVEGDWVSRERVVIDSDELMIADLEQQVVLDRVFDMAVCLEVAEHLSGPAAPRLVKLLTSLSDVILFSAAIPGQYGQNHINEQWPDYWIELFRQHDYFCFDDLRSELWNNKNIFWWYKQNIFIVIKRGRSHPFSKGPVLNVIHPDLFTYRLGQLQDVSPKFNSIMNGDYSLRLYFFLFVRTAIRKFKKFFFRKK